MLPACQALWSALSAYYLIKHNDPLGCYYHAYFTDEETETQRDLNSSSKTMQAESGGVGIWIPGSFSPEAKIFPGLNDSRSYFHREWQGWPSITMLPIISQECSRHLLQICITWQGRARGPGEGSSRRGHWVLSNGKSKPGGGLPKAHGGKEEIIEIKKISSFLWALVTPSHSAGMHRGWHFSGPWNQGQLVNLARPCLGRR